MKKVLTITSVFLFIGTSIQANAIEEYIREDPSYEFATDAANAEWGDTVNSNGEYYDAWNEWYQMCDSL
ncbi:hypothetical protein INR75_05060 [Zunongwangia sp. SCSIO 43204]|uniref:hypothetical protein n=1 Tax=Zunongwangia sp. SCSIO 43204 TaxID=2779359 RepID=UPI001CA972E2|nr:hypothetical protein [Zunongwangia sp. SCSIO 43204]UAB85390.1 hypothetical protein INR75_05060 [Zunongwangia sp. SCSIO 43204]